MDETTPEPAAASIPAGSRSDGPGVSPRLVVAAGLFAGLLSWLAGEAAHGRFRPATRDVAVMGGGGSPVADGPALSAAETKNAVLVFGLAGASLGGALALAGGRPRPDPKLGAVGAALGGLAGAGAAKLVIPIFWRVWYGDRSGPLDPDALLFPLLIHSGVNAAIGAAGGAAFALAGRTGSTGIVKSALTGLVGGVVAAILFEVCAAILFADVRNMHPIPPTWAGRVVDRLLLPVAVSSVLVLGLLPRRRRA